MALIAASLVLAANLGGCEQAPTHPTLRGSDLPKLIPVRDLFAHPLRSERYRVSPDGKKLAWLAIADGRRTLHVQTIGEQRVSTIAAHRPVRKYRWAEDSRHLLVFWDGKGDENWHLYLADSERPEVPPRNLTPFPGARVQIQQLPRNDPAHILITHNRRDRTVYDLYRLNLLTGIETLIAENPGDVTRWITSREGKLLLRIHKGKTRDFEALSTDSQRWRTVFTRRPHATFDILGHPVDLSRVWALSNQGHDRLSLVRFDMETGRETLILQDPIVDLSHVWMDLDTNEPIAAVSWPNYKRYYFFDKSLERDVAPFQRDEAVRLYLRADNARRMLLVKVASEQTGTEYHLLDRQTEAHSLLAGDPIAKHSESLSRTRPISYTARDGLRIHGYLTTPQGTAGQQLPMVLRVHGGPWERDYAGYYPVVQFLANRGYAVLRVNYRGSKGYGRAFMEAGWREFAGKMQDDLIDGVHWAIERGIADPERIAIMGRSYGGYAALVGLAFTPEVFAAGVSVVGISELASFVESAPRYWRRRSLPRWHVFVGDPENAADQMDMKARSPLYHIDRIKRPLMVVHGANDVRVRKEQSDRMVKALRRRGIATRYLVFDDEGHSIRRRENWISLARELEDFLASHLGGRRTGIDLTAIWHTVRALFVSSPPEPIQPATL